eukprot:3165649-Rhodomonas_salina.3
MAESMLDNSRVSVLFDIACGSSVAYPELHAYDIASDMWLDLSAYRAGTAPSNAIYRSYSKSWGFAASHGKLYVLGHHDHARYGMLMYPLHIPPSAHDCSSDTQPGLLHADHSSSLVSSAI